MRAGSLTEISSLPLIRLSTEHVGRCRDFITRSEREPGLRARRLELEMHAAPSFPALSPYTHDRGDGWIIFRKLEKRIAGALRCTGARKRVHHGHVSERRWHF
jgi:hypothetical protein